MTLTKETHQVDGGVELGDELHAVLLAVSDVGQGSGVRSLPEFGGEGAQADVVARLLPVKPCRSFRLQLCHQRGNIKVRSHKIS